MEDQVIAKSSDSELNKLITVLPVPEKLRDLPALSLFSPAQAISCLVGAESWSLLAASFDGELHLVCSSLMNFIVDSNRLCPQAAPVYSDGHSVSWERVARASMEYHEELKQTFFENDHACEVAQPMNRHECQRFVTNLMASGLLKPAYQRRASLLSEALANNAVWDKWAYRCMMRAGFISGKKASPVKEVAPEFKQQFERELKQGLIPGLTKNNTRSEIPLSLSQRGHKVCRSLFGGKHGRAI